MELNAGKAWREAESLKARALTERLESAPVTQTSDGQHIGWRFPLSCNIYRTRELAIEFGGSEPELCCTHFARADSLIRIPLTFRQYEAELARELAA